MNSSDSTNSNTDEVAADDSRKLLDELQWSERPLERLVLTSQALSGVIYDWDATIGRVVRSSGLIDLIGFRPDEADPHDGWWNSRIHPQDREKVAKKFAESERHCNVEYRILHRDGYYVHVSDQALVLRDKSGKIQRIVGSNIDISHHKQIQDTLEHAYKQERRAREEAESTSRRLRRIQRVTMALASAVTPGDVAQGILAELETALLAQRSALFLFEPRTQSLVLIGSLGLSPDEAEKLALVSIRAKTQISQALISKNSVVFNRKEQDSGASVEPFPDSRFPDSAAYFSAAWFGSFIAKPMIVNGQPIGVLAFGTANELTLKTEERQLLTIISLEAAQVLERTRLFENEKQLREVAERASLAKDEFFAMVSHELRSPLQSILGWIRLAKGSKLDPVTSEHALEVMERNARAQVQLVSDLLETSRIITGKIAIDLQPLGVSTLLEEAIESIKPTAQNKGVVIELIVTSKLPLILGDENRLNQMFWNLLANAVKFTAKGGKITVQAKQLAETLEISVQDTGEGIDAQFLPYVFERFKQGTVAHTKLHGGLGLGLSIVKHLAQLHGGSVSAHSNGPGEGSTFTLKLPSRANTDSSSSEHERNIFQTHGKPSDFNAEIEPFLSAKLADISVLLVEDTADSRELFEIILKSEGAEVTSVTSAEEALVALKTFTPDILVSDIGLAGDDGYVLVANIRKTLNAQQLPAIAMTAFARFEDKERALKAGFQAHVPKPVDAELLIECVARLVKAKTRTPADLLAI